MKEREQIEQSIAALETQRSVLGDSVVEAALPFLGVKLPSLDEPSGKPITEPERFNERERYLLTGERRVLTILFCDVKGSTAMAEQLDPEEWAEILQRAIEYLTEPIRHQRGTVAQLLGDGILAFFGTPVAHEDDPQRAVLAGLEILEGIRVLHTKIMREHRLDFSVRVGIHTGLVVVKGVSNEGQVEYTAVGDTVNLAARMEQTARPGTLQISEQTYKLVEQIFECESLGGDQNQRQAPASTNLSGDRSEGRARSLAWAGAAGLAFLAGGTES